ncbi:Hypothetical predicted protein [Lecanosticta acicola]|uniref:Uncharacterized protein n=1 Tax=Lecanosticta acicola TaxID=111012 RepID=A0AAI9E706_9PEZI|nr:Hypothetical predicted protein [Lecanosticta acicola]
MSGMADLIEHLLFEVARSGFKGLTEQRFERLVTAFYDKGNSEPAEANGTRHDNVTPSVPVEHRGKIDAILFDDIFQRLCDHPDIGLREIKGQGVGEEEEQVPDSMLSHALKAKLSGKRIFTTDERMWRALTGHGVDHTRIPGKQFELLANIAAFGPAGVLQPHLAQMTEQDNRSVPTRTDTLAAKGYITKEPVIGAGTKTSLLRLKPFVPLQSLPQSNSSDGQIISDQDPSPPRWNTNLPINNIIHDLINESGQKGITAGELTSRLTGHLWRSSVEDILACLVTSSRRSQPLHLKHLAITRNEEIFQGEPRARYRTVSNFDKAVAAGEVIPKTTKRIGRLSRADTDNSNSEVDEWGFPVIVLSSSAEPTELTQGAKLTDAADTNVSAPKAWIGNFKRTAYVDDDEARGEDGSLGPSQSSDNPAKRVTRGKRVRVDDFEAAAALGEVEGSQKKRQKRSPRADGDRKARRKRRRPEGELDGSDTNREENHASSTPAADAETPRAKKKYLLPELPVVKKRKITEEEREEYEIAAQATAERRARVEMRLSIRRKAAEIRSSGGPTEQATDLASISVSLEQDDDHEQIPPERVAQIKADILAQVKPGVYIDPPEARKSKLENFIRRGRPRKSLLAVVKTPHLKQLTWFKDDSGPRYAPIRKRAEPKAVTAADVPSSKDRPDSSVPQSNIGVPTGDTGRFDQPNYPSAKGLMQPQGSRTVQSEQTASIVPTQKQPTPEHPVTAVSPPQSQQQWPASASVQSQAEEQVPDARPPAAASRPLAGVLVPTTQPSHVNNATHCQQMARVERLPTQGIDPTSLSQRAAVPEQGASGPMGLNGSPVSSAPPGPSSVPYEPFSIFNTFPGSTMASRSGSYLLRASPGKLSARAPWYETAAPGSKSSQEESNSARLSQDRVDELSEPSATASSSTNADRILPGQSQEVTPQAQSTSRAAFPLAKPLPTRPSKATVSAQVQYVVNNMSDESAGRNCEYDPTHSGTIPGSSLPVADIIKFTPSNATPDRSATKARTETTKTTSSPTLPEQAATTINHGLPASYTALAPPRPSLISAKAQLRQLRSKRGRKLADHWTRIAELEQLIASEPSDLSIEQEVNEATVTPATRALLVKLPLPKRSSTESHEASSARLESALQANGPTLIFPASDYGGQSSPVNHVQAVAPCDTTVEENSERLNAEFSSVQRPSAETPKAEVHQGASTSAGPPAPVNAGEDEPITGADDVGQPARLSPESQPQEDYDAAATTPTTPTVSHDGNTYLQSTPALSLHYVLRHPNETFHHRGAGLYARGLPPVTTKMKTKVYGPGAEAWYARRAATIREAAEPVSGGINAPPSAMRQSSSPAESKSLVARLPIPRRSIPAHNTEYDGPRYQVPPSAERNVLGDQRASPVAEPSASGSAKPIEREKNADRSAFPSQERFTSQMSRTQVSTPLAIVRPYSVPSPLAVIRPYRSFNSLTATPNHAPPTTNPAAPSLSPASRTGKPGGISQHATGRQHVSTLDEAYPMPFEDPMNIDTNTNNSNSSAPAPANTKQQEKEKGAGQEKLDNRTARAKGSVADQRQSIILDALHSCNGCFPGNEEPLYVLATAWKKLHSEDLDQRTIELIIRNMVDSKKLKKITFQFKTSTGMLIKRLLLLEPNIDPYSQPVKDLRKNMVSAFPSPFIPAGIEVSNEIIAKMGNSQKGTRLTASAPSVGARREGTKSPSGLGNDVAVPGVKRKRSALHNGNGRESDDADEDDDEEISPGQAAMQGEMQLGNYWHDSTAVPSKLRPYQRLVKTMRLDHPTKTTTGRFTSTMKGSVDTSIGKEPRRSRDADGGMTFDDMTEQQNRASSALLLRPRQEYYETSGTFSSSGCADVESTPDSRTLRNRADRLDGLMQGFGASKRLVTKSGSSSSSMQARLQQQRDAAKLQQLRKMVENDGEQAKLESGDAATLKLLDNRRRQRNWVSSDLHRGRKPDDDDDTDEFVPSEGGNGENISESDEDFSSEDASGTASRRSGLVKLKVRNLASLVAPSKPKRKYKSRAKQTAAADEDLGNSDVDYVPGTAKVRVKAGSDITNRDRKSSAEFKDTSRLVTAIALVNLVCGGVNQSLISWGIVSHALSFRHDGDFLRRRWSTIRKLHSATANRLQDALREPFLEAYQNDELPVLDFQNLSATDWPSLFQWAEETRAWLESSKGSYRIPGLVTKSKLEEQFEILERAPLFELSKNEYFTTPTDLGRRHLALRYNNSSVLPNQVGSDKDSQSDMLLKSWARAIAVTKQWNYDSIEASKKIKNAFQASDVERATRSMADAHILTRSNKSILPGRNFELSNDVLSQFRRWPAKPDEHTYLRHVAGAWSHIMQYLERNDQLQLIPAASDPEYVILTNLVAQGELKLTVALPERNNNFDAPLPKFTPWSYSGTNYETKKVNAAMLKFPLVYTKTSKFNAHHALKRGVPVPSQADLVAGEKDHRIPFWTDIHGNLIDDIWDMVLRSILHLLVFRAGSTAKEMERAHDRKLWAWEIELALEWMERVGIAARCVTGGWRAGGSWYCAFSPDIATWKAPQGADLVTYG